MKWWCNVVLWLLQMWLVQVDGAFVDDHSNNRGYSTSNCPDLNSQEQIALDKIMGKWYVVEVLGHRTDPHKQVTGSYVVNSCPTVDLRTLEPSSLGLLWTENAGTLEYTFRIPETRRPGYWISTSLQNGTLAQGQYNQFTGVVHVMKAVASDMVLTFCSRVPNHQLYSLLLSREHVLQRSDKQGVHNLLRRRNLQIINIRETCVNSSARRIQTMNLISWLLVFATLLVGVSTEISL